MIVCPVCEHQQVQGDKCDVCDKQLVATAPPTAVVAERLADLESTGLAGVTAPVQVEVLPELALHRIPDAAVTTLEAVPGFERTKLPDAEVPAAAETLAEMERTNFESDGQRTALPSQITCRYCRHIQASGAVCDGCGRALPRALARDEKPSQSSLVACPACAVKGEFGRLCRACGAYIRTPTV